MQALFWIIIILCFLAIFLGAKIQVKSGGENQSDKIKDLEKRVQNIQDTLDHYSIRMSNKMPDKNKYYKRWYK